jgi:hypothetical protein
MTHRRGAHSVILAAVIVGLIISGCLVWGSSTAMFTATTANPSNSFAAGAVALSDDDTGLALFSVTNLHPGDSGSRCLRVTYTGDIQAIVRFYTTASSYTGTLGPYLTLTIEEGGAGTYANATCSNWTTGTVVYTGLLSAFAATYTNYTTGAYNAGGAWTPTTNGQFKVYRFAYQLSASAPSSMQAASAGIGFTWEAQG